MTIDWSNTRPTCARKRPSWRCSRANAFTTRTPLTFSSTSAVSSAIRCWTSCSAGRAIRPYRAATNTTTGTGASEIAASPGSVRNMATAASTIVSPDWSMKISP